MIQICLMSRNLFVPVYSFFFLNFNYLFAAVLQASFDKSFFSIGRFINNKAYFWTEETMYCSCICCLCLVSLSYIQSYEERQCFLTLQT